MSDWKKDEDALDELLNKMPKFTDHRSKEDVYNRVKLEVEDQVKEEKKQFTRVSLARWMPFVVSLASILILTFLVSTYMNDSEKEMSMSTDRTSEGVEQKSSKEDSMRSMDTAEQASSDAEVVSSDEMSAMSILETPVELLPLNNLKTVYEGSLEGGTVFHFSFLENALSVPVTIIIPKDQMDIDFPNMTPNSLQLYERYARLIDEKSLGFEDYHPYKGFFAFEGKMLQHYLPVGHGYDTASGTAVPYWTSINEIFTDFDTLMRLNEDGTPVLWDQSGILSEPSPLRGSKEQVYFKYSSLNGKVYLASKYITQNAAEAFVHMKDSQDDIYTSAIPKEVNYSYRDDNGTAVIHFDKLLDLTTMDSNDASLMIEAFSLTAASFGEEVKLENVIQTEWNGFDLTKPLPIPLGPNGFIMNTK